MRKRSVCSILLTLVSLGGSPVTAREDPGKGRGADFSPERSILLQNVRVFDVSAGEMSGSQDILIADGRIASIGNDLSPGSNTETIECEGKYAVPGLFDCHVHLAHLTNKGGDTLQTALAGFVSRGVTHVRDVGGPIDVLHRLNELTASGEILGPEIFYAGPMLEHSPLTWDRFNEDLPGFTVAVDSTADVDSILPALARQGACMIKTFSTRIRLFTATWWRRHTDSPCASPTIRVDLCSTAYPWMWPSTSGSPASSMRSPLGRSS